MKTKKFMVIALSSQLSVAFGSTAALELASRIDSPVEIIPHNPVGGSEANMSLPLEAVKLRTFSWKATPDSLDHLRNVRTIARRIAYVLMSPEIDSDTGCVEFENGAAVMRSSFAHVGVPVRNQLNEVRMEWGDSPFAIVLRDTDAFGEVLIEIIPSKGKATAYSITIDRVMKGGVSYASPQPEEQLIQRIGRFEFHPVGGGVHCLTVKAVEETVSLAIDHQEIFQFEDPDVAAGCFGICTPKEIRLISIEQDELITEEKASWREDFTRQMSEFCQKLDEEREADIAAKNSLSLDGDTLTWRYPETEAVCRLTAEYGRLFGEVYPGLYGNPRMLSGPFAYPEVISSDGQTYRLASDKKPVLSGSPTHFQILLPLASSEGQATMSFIAKFTENATWFCTAEVEGIPVEKVALGFGLDKDFEPNWSASSAGEPAKLAYGTATLITDGTTDPSREGFGIGPSDGKGLQSSFICTNSVVGHVWKALSGQDTMMEVLTVGSSPMLVLRSQKPKFRWAIMWLPFHKLNLTGYEKRMVHFIRYPETPNHEWRERPSACEYPTDEELERFAANGAKAMVWHHTWTSNNFRKREGFIVNDVEMHRAMKKAHSLGIAVITYIGIVPGRHPVLQYEDISTRMFYDKNWDLQDFTFYSVAGRFADFFPYITDYWCREYGLDGFYIDGGIAMLDWGRTGLSEEDFGGLSLEELNDRLYSRVKKVLQRHNAGFGLENWGGSPLHLAGPWYDCRMIGESFQETSPESYRDAFNPLLTGTPFKMYGMDLTARNRYNVAMAAVCMTDIQMCSGNYAWGNWPDMPSDWANIGPFWKILDSIEWNDLVEARPWWAQHLILGDGFYAGYYLTSNRLVFFLANRKEEKAMVKPAVDLNRLPKSLQTGKIRRIYPETEEWQTLDDGAIEVELPCLHDGPVGFEIVP